MLRVSRLYCFNVDLLAVAACFKSSTPGCLQSQWMNLWTPLQLPKCKSRARKCTQINNPKRGRKGEKADKSNCITMCEHIEFCLSALCRFCFFLLQSQTVNEKYVLRCRQLLQHHIPQSGVQRNEKCIFTSTGPP